MREETGRKYVLQLVCKDLLAQLDLLLEVDLKLAERPDSHKQRLSEEAEVGWSGSILKQYRNMSTLVTFKRDGEWAGADLSAQDLVDALEDGQEKLARLAPLRLRLRPRQHERALVISEARLKIVHALAKGARLGLRCLEAL